MFATKVALAASILLCSMVAGLVFTFAVVVMPGIRSLKDRDFLRAFVVMDRVIQNNHPLFMMVWLGSAVAVIALAMLSLWQINGLNLYIAIGCSVVYVIGVQLPTMTINIPLNNKLQSMNLDSMTESEISTARNEFEPRWTLWNSIRTIIAVFVSGVLIILALVI